jgi:aspartyl-tRNA(Asn)/glutamyl-tRNA(Gln) amidotransferase subunit A
MSDLNKLTLAAARDQLRAKDITSVELTEACLAEIEGSGALNTFVHQTPELALERARCRCAFGRGGCAGYVRVADRD